MNQKNEAPNQPDLANLRTVGQLCKEYPQLFTEGKLRWLIFNADTNGFSTCIIRIGRRIYIDTTELTRWMKRR
jgi:hypothetical protein